MLPAAMVSGVIISPSSLLLTSTSIITGRPGAGVCLFLCLFVFRPTREFSTHFFTFLETSPFVYLLVPLEYISLIRRRHHCKILLAIMAIEQWGFYSVPHLLWHGAFVFNGHLRGPVTLLPSVWQWCCHYLFLRPVACIRAFASYAEGWVLE